MNTFLKDLKKYRWVLILLILVLLLVLIVPDTGKKAFSTIIETLIDMLLVIPPIYITFALLDVWVDRDTMIKYMGEGSEIKGTFFAFILGSIGVGPIYIAFPISNMLINKGVTLHNVYIFLGAWCTTKITLVLFECTSLGLKYMLIRLGFNIIGVILVAWLLDKTTTKKEKQAIIENSHLVV